MADEAVVHTGGNTPEQVAYKRLLDDAADSPVVDDEGSADQLFGGLLVTHGF